MTSLHPLLRASLAFALICCSIALLIFTVKYNPARAQESTATNIGAMPVGIIQHDLQRDGKPGFLIHVIGYSPAQPRGAVTVLAKEWVAR